MKVVMTLHGIKHL